SSLLAGLSQEQRTAVTCSEGPVLILAGAGSGKTRVITYRIAHLVLERGISSERILAMTFTNKAADEMRSRVTALLGDDRLRAWISTFHGFCVRLLRQDGAHIGVRRDFGIYDESDQRAVVREALRLLDLPEERFPLRAVLSRLTAAKSRGASLEDGSGGMPLAQIAASYQEILGRTGALDFDDLLIKAVELLESCNDVRDRWQRRFEYVLVDEYQDTNRLQHEMLRRLVRPGGNLTVVGDEDQSIYSWRGADLGNILGFERDFGGARVLRLEDNYRSSQAILDAAAGLVRHNRMRKEKSLKALRPLGEPVVLYSAKNDYEEARWIVSHAARLRGKGSVAVLYRLNAQSRLVEEELIRHGLPYFVLGGVGFYERREVKDVLAYARLALTPQDPIAFRRVLNVPPRGIGRLTLNAIEDLAAATGVCLLDAARQLVAAGELPSRTTSSISRFLEIIELVRSWNGLSIRRFLERIIETTGYDEELAREKREDDRRANVEELLNAAADYQTRETMPSLAGFLDQASLLSAADKKTQDDRICLMTLHAAKGLEFSTVFLSGLEEGVLPHSKSLKLSDSAIEEERRLCYVGMTRARDRLLLSWARMRSIFGRRSDTTPSRFLNEIPARASDDSRHRQWSAPRAEIIPRSTTEGLRPGERVRHPVFGVGTILRTDGDGHEAKITVSFASVGMKRLLTRFAGLERS
ncbi:MAG: UvrD-helicase domain-containing protein, partial [Vicinamibacteria bacterium]|nr:UvrD-helicase domain-containing protein [Vicinamibacteria bacterium]